MYELSENRMNLRGLKSLSFSSNRQHTTTKFEPKKKSLYGVILLIRGNLLPHYEMSDLRNIFSLSFKIDFKDLRVNGLC